MEPRTECLGHLDVVPALNAAEATYLRTLRQPRDDEAPSDPGRPASPCCWSVCRDGCCLLLDGTATADEGAWLRYLIGHLLKRGAVASRSRLLRHDRFTFDHRVSGVVVGRRPGSGELFTITARDNRVSERVLSATASARARGTGHRRSAVVIDLATRRATRR